MSSLPEAQVSTTGSGSPTSTPQAVQEGDFVIEGEFPLECGRALTRPVLHYAVYGQLSEQRDNLVLVCHALSGSALVGEWWPGLFHSNSASGVDGDPGGIVDLARQCVICVNLLGSCYGSTGPGSIDPSTHEVYGPDFPVVSVRDNVRAQALLLDSLRIEQIELAIGGSIGGMQALEWTILYPKRVKRAVIIAVAPLSAMGLALNHLQRQAIAGDPDWLAGKYSKGRQPRRGLALARGLAMLSYKSSALFAQRFGRRANRNGEDPWADAGLDSTGEGSVISDSPGSSLLGGRFDVAGFLDYQGERFLERFDANSYLAILKTMDLWDPARDYTNRSDAFARIEAELVFVGISSDWLFPAADVRRLAMEVAAAGVKADYREMVTDHGHDAFLAEQQALVALLKPERDRD